MSHPPSIQSAHDFCTSVRRLTTPLGKPTVQRLGRLCCKAPGRLLLPPLSFSLIENRRDGVPSDSLCVSLLPANITFHSKLPHCSQPPSYAQPSIEEAWVGLGPEIVASIIQVAHTDIKRTKEHHSFECTSKEAREQIDDIAMDVSLYCMTVKELSARTASG